MINLIRQLLGMGPTVNYRELVESGAQIIDVRTKPEFDSGSIRGSINIPLNVLTNHLSRIKSNRPVIVCCASGMRSSMARKILISKGYKEVHNGGGWMRLQSRLS